MPWIKTIEAATVESEEIAAAQAGKDWVVLYAADGGFYASAVLCSHGQASLADGYLEDFLIECPLHQGTFDIRTGEPVDPPCTEPVRVYPTKVEDGFIYVEVEENET